MARRGAGSNTSRVSTEAYSERVSDREWIVATLLDREATDGEVEAAVRAATPAELEGVQRELDMRIWWQGERIRDLRGAVEHLADQNPGFARG